MTVQTNDGKFACAKWIVDTNGLDAGATHTTIAAALTSAVSGETIFIKTGTYTENLTLKSGVNLASFSSEAYNGQVEIVGKCTATFAGSCSIAGIRLTTNSDFCLAVTGTSATLVTLKDCYISCSDNTGISFTTSSSTAVINIIDSRLDVETTGIAFFASTSAGFITFFNCNMDNTGSSTTSSTISAGVLTARHCVGNPIITTSGTAVIQMTNSAFSSGNTTFVTHGSTAANSLVEQCQIGSGTASTISVSAGATIELTQCKVKSSNTNAITGAGTVNFSGLCFTGTSNIINTTTQEPKTLSNNLRKVLHPAAYPYTVIKSDDVLMIDTSSARTINLPASPQTGLRYTIKDDVGTAATNNITITPASGNIDGAASFFVDFDYASIDVVYNGSEWSTLAGGTTANKEYYFKASDFDALETNFAPLNQDNGATSKILSRAFDDTTEEFVNFSIKAPSDIDLVSTVTFRVWMYAATAAADKFVKLTFDHRDVDNSESWDGAYVSEDSGDIAIDATQDDITEATWTETVANLGWAANDFVMCRLSRIAPAGTDLTGDLYVVGFAVEIPRS